MDVECEVCINRRVCAKTLKECRGYGGGRVDPYLIIGKLRKENKALKSELQKVRNNDKTNI